jgi:hypothetical protein
MEGMRGSGIENGCAYHRRAILEGDQVVGETLIAQAFELREIVMRKGKNTKNGPSRLDW